MIGINRVRRFKYYSRHSRSHMTSIAVLLTVSYIRALFYISRDGDPKGSLALKWPLKVKGSFKVIKITRFDTSHMTSY